MEDIRSQPPSPTLADRLTMIRRKRFVGRSAELEWFRTLLIPDPPYPLLYVHGPGGVGKSTLLRECAAIAEGETRPCLFLDGREIAPSPSAFLSALQGVIGISDAAFHFPSFFANQPQTVLFLDTYEALTPLDVWLREQFLPHLPGEMRVVIAGRFPPPNAWREAGWIDLIRVISLRNLPPLDSVTFLNTRHVPEHHQTAIIAATHGHPLALSLVGDIIAQSPAAHPFELNQSPNVVRLLLDRFVQEVPTSLHREALEVSAHVRVTTEALLADIFEPEQAIFLFAWLRDLSFIEQNAQGIFPHDLARDVLDTELRWRNSEQYARMHHRVRAYIVQRFQQSNGLAQQRAFFDLLYLHRHSPMMRPYYDWGGMGDAYAEPIRSDDIPLIVEMVREHEGAESARIAAYWIEAYPQYVMAFRRGSDPIFGFGLSLMLGGLTGEQCATDPAMAKIWAFIQRHPPLRAGDLLLIHRFWMGKEGHQLNTAAHNMMAMLCGRLWMTTPKLVWAFVCLTDPVHFHPMFTYLRFVRVPEVDFMVDGDTYSVFAHDWRAESMLAWLANMAEQELALEAQPDGYHTTPSIVVLSQAEFKESVRHALRDYHSASLLAENPLLHSRLCLEQERSPHPTTLQQLLRSATAALQNSPKEEKFYRALHYTYFEPLATQELVAERLDLPFSTYRYHLSNGIERVTDWLWQKELYS